MAGSSCGAGAGGGLILRRRRAGIGPDQPRSQPARLARSVTLPATVLIRLSTHPPTSPGFRWNRVISGAEVRNVDRSLTDVAMIVTLRALFAVAHIIAPHRFGPLHKGRIPSCESIPASYTMAMLSTIYDTYTCSLQSSIDGGPRNSPSNRSCAFDSTPVLRTRLHTLDRDFSCPENGGGIKNHL
jgi:hypothetical protein